MNAVIYARYSSHGQSEQSIEGQLRDCYAFAKREGYTVINEYIDRALTGRTDSRPAFQQMISDAAGKQFEVILVWKLDRFARNRYDSAMYKAKLRKYGVKVISATERISDDPEGIILEGMLESLAEYYSANLSKHVKRGMRDAALKGTFVGGTIPLGYKVVDKKIVIDEKTAPAVIYAFEQYEKGKSKKIIAEELNAKGYRTAQGKPFTANSFEIFLRRKYIGEYTHDGIEVAGGCPALISEELFNKVRERLETRKHTALKGTGKVVYYLTGKAFCGICGARLVGDAGTSRNGTRHDYYSCSKRKKSRSCKKAAEGKGFLEWYVVEQTVEYVLNPARIEYIADLIIDAYKNDFGVQRITDLERRIRSIDGDINKALDASIEAPSGRR